MNLSRSTRAIATFVSVALLCGCGQTPAPADGSSDAIDGDGTDGRSVAQRVAQVQRTCMMVTVCRAYLDPDASSPLFPVDDCMATMLMPVQILEPAGGDRFARYLHCAGESPDCRSLERCLTAEHGPAYCLAHPGNTCDENSLIRCGTSGGYALAVTDCGSIGMSCMENNGTAGCSVGSVCAVPGTTNCNGNTRYECDAQSNLLESIDCTRIGTGYICQEITGVTGITDGAYCVPQSGFCATEHRWCSDAHTMAACRMDVSGVIIGEPRVACDEMIPDAMCVEMGGSSRCVSSDSQCTADACEGAVVRTCYGGRYYSLDCREIGLNHCGILYSHAFCMD